MGLRQQRADAVDDVADAGNDQEDTQPLGNIAGLDCQPTDDEQVRPEKDEPSVVDVGEPDDPRQRFGVSQIHASVAAPPVLSSRSTPRKLGDGKREDAPVHDPHPCPTADRILLTGTKTRYSPHATTRSSAITIAQD